MITTAQKRIIVAAVLAVITFGVCWLWMYIPAREKIRRLKTELNETELQIAQIEELVGSRASDRDGMVLLKEHADHLDQKFPKREEESLELLSDFAARVELAVRSLRTSHKMALGGVGQIDGKTCRRVEISLDLIGTFQSVIRYLDLLKRDLPALTTIEMLKLQKHSGSGSQLDVSIRLNMYLLSGS